MAKEDIFCSTTSVKKKKKNQQEENQAEQLWENINDMSVKEIIVKRLHIMLKLVYSSTSFIVVPLKNMEKRKPMSSYTHVHSWAVFFAFMEHDFCRFKKKKVFFANVHVQGKQFPFISNKRQ